MGWCVSQGFYCCDETPGPKASWGEKGFIKLTLPHCLMFITKGRQDRNLEAGVGMLLLVWFDDEQ